MKKILTASISVLLLIASSRAAVSVSYTDRANAGFEVSNSDLLQTNLSTINPFPNAGAFQLYGVLGVPELNNGIFGALGGPGDQHVYQSATAGSGGGFQPAGQSILYTLDGGNLGQGYDLTGISTYAGWDAFRGGQSYTVAYSTVFNLSTFIDIATVYDDFHGPFLGNTEAKIASSGSPLATNVSTIRFTFNGGLSQGFAGYRELDVFGSSTSVPEPTSALLMTAGAISLLARRQRQSRN